MRASGRLSVALLLAGCLLQAGCVAPAAAPTAPEARQIAASATESGRTATMASTATPSPVPSATRTLTPTALATFTPTYTPAPSPSATVTPVPPSVTATRIRPTATPTTMSTTPVSPLPIIVAYWQTQSILVGPGAPPRLYAHQHYSEWRLDGPMDRLWMSDDWGQSWAPFPGGLPQSARIHAVNLDYAQRDALYVSAEQGLFRWTGTTWKKLYDREVSMAAVTYKRPEQIWAVSRTEGVKRYTQVIHSEDSGRTWNEGNLSGNGEMTLALDPSASDRRYALWENPAGMFDLWRWTQGGWLQLAPPTGFKLSDSYHPKMRDAQGWALDGATGDLYIACDDRETCGYAHQIWRSRNPSEDNPVDVKWELFSDFGVNYRVRLLASGPTPKGAGLALYAAFQEYSSDYCAPLGAELPAVWYADGGWSYLQVPLAD